MWWREGSLSDFVRRTESPSAYDEYGHRRVIQGTSSHAAKQSAPETPRAPRSDDQKATLTSVHDIQQLCQRGALAHFGPNSPARPPESGSRSVCVAPSPAQHLLV